jgi:hypothetical protein
VDWRQPHGAATFSYKFYATKELIMNQTIEQAKENLVDVQGYPTATIDVLFDKEYFDIAQTDTADDIVDKAVAFLDGLTDAELEELDLY